MLVAPDEIRGKRRKKDNPVGVEHV